MMNPFTYSFLVVVTTFLGMFLISITGIFDFIELEIGFEHYAESQWIPFFNFMPLNTMINVGYSGLGLYWCGFTHMATQQGILKDIDSKLFFALNIMCTIYGGVQMMRITTQEVIWAVLDQWCTLPFFALLLHWGLYLKYGWSHSMCVFIMSLSLFSFILTLFLKIGFEIALGIHIICAIYGGIVAYQRYPAKGSLRTFYAALFSCCGFVFLKLIDFQLPHLCFVFEYISGHFLSKICDICQIHFVNVFFLDLTLEKAADLSVQDKLHFFNSTEMQDLFKKFQANDIMYEIPEKLKNI